MQRADLHQNPVPLGYIVAGTDGRLSVQPENDEHAEDECNCFGMIWHTDGCRSRR